MAKNRKITTGANDRPRDVSIGQTAEGLPDDSSQPVQADEDQIERIRKALAREPQKKGKKRPAAN
ncbi:hypothetical protein [Mesorhizobium sp. B263B2A]|uniref:hypothetical protein n=1 Tax=Mesorhizobium sp. B263B2A TaxID=2876669 RepID=UPI001CD0A4FC|nr:hypothetical protein [Mesorhizobium sp. B263B2A]MCA0032184.1 hypothetical protein [Mesorhizobium sp. B263B2A]